MSTSPCLSFLSRGIPLTSQPWLAASLLQDPVIHQAATNLFEIDFSGSHSASIDLMNANDWSPAAIGLRMIAPNLSPQSLREFPIQDIDEDLKENALRVSSSAPIPSEEWNLEKAMWIALAMRSDYFAKGTWEPAIKRWLCENRSQCGTILACLFGIVPTPVDVFRSMLQLNPVAQNAALSLHALLSNPLDASSQLELLVQMISDSQGEIYLPLSTQLVFLHILECQRPQLAIQFAQLLSDDETSITGDGWTYQDPTTYLYETEKNLIKNRTRYLISLDPESLNEVNNWKHIFSQTPEGVALSTLADLVESAVTHQFDDQENAYLLGQQASNYLIDYIANIPNLLLADSRLLPIIHRLSDLFSGLNRPSCTEKVLLSACAIQPSNPTLLLLLASAQRKLKKYPDAIQSLTTALMLSPNRLDLLTQLAECLEQDNQWESALPIRQALYDQQCGSEQPDVKRELYSLMNCALQADQAEKCLQLAQDYLMINPQDAYSLYYSGQAYIHLGMMVEAQKILAEATELCFDHPIVWLGLAKYHLSNGDEEQAINTLQSAMNAVPDNAEIYFQLGELHLKNLAYTQAEEAYSRANQITPTDPQIAYQYAKVLRHLGLLESAKQVLSKALSANPEDDELTYGYADILISLSEYALALPYLESLLNDDRLNSVEPLIIYSQALLKTAENNPEKIRYVEKAVQALSKVISIDSSNVIARGMLAEALSASGKFPEALEAYQAVMDSDLANNPDWATRIPIGIAFTALELNKPDIAIASLQDVIQKDPTTSYPYRLLAEAYLIADLPDNSMRAAQSALTLENADRESIQWMVTFIKKIYSYKHSGLSTPINQSLLDQVLGDSIQAIETIIISKPELIDLAISQGELFALSGDMNSAHQSYSSLANSELAKSSDLISAAEHLYSLDDSKTAILCLQRAVEAETLEFGKPTIGILQQLAQAYAKSGNLQLAQKTFDQAITAEPSNPYLYTAKARLLIEVQQTQEAISCLQNALSNVPSEQIIPDLYYTTAVAYLAEGNLPLSLEYALNALDIDRGTISEHTSSKSVNFTDDQHIARYTLAAELSRALLQPETALELLEECHQSSNPAFKDQASYVEYFCLFNELNLEGHGKIVQQLDFPSTILCAQENPRLLSLNARLANWKGNPGQAIEFASQAKELLDNSGVVRHPVSTTFDEIIYLYPRYMAIANAAIELRQWETAHNYLRKGLHLVPTNPLANLCLSRFYILRAEYQDICQSCFVVRHSPGPEALSESAARGARKALTSLRELLESMQGQSDKVSIDSNNLLVSRWQARADLIFERDNRNTSALKKLSSSQDHDAYSFHYTPEDTAAVIAANRKQPEEANDGVDLFSYIKTSYKKYTHPLVLLQISTSLGQNYPQVAIDACKLARKYLHNNCNDVSTLCHIYEANIYMQQNMLEDAQEKIESALDVWPDEPRWNALAAEIKSQAGDVLGEVSNLEEAVKYEPNNVKHLVSLGRAYMKLIGTYTQADSAIYQKRAIRNLERASRLAPQDPEVWIVLTQAHSLIGDTDQANLSVDKALGITPENYTALTLKAEIALSLDQPQQAYDYAKKASSLHPDEPTAHLILARALDILDHPGEALQALEIALPQTSNPLPLQLEHAGLVKQLQGTGVALEELKSLADRFPNDPDVLSNLADAYAECDQDEQAIQYAQKSLQSGGTALPASTQAQIHHLLGRLMRKTGQLDQALVHLIKATQLSPNTIEPFLELGIAHQERREFQQALQIFQQATQVANRDPRPFYMAGMALKEGKDYRQSESMLRKAASLAPLDVNIKRQLAAVVALNLVHNPGSMMA